MPSRNDFQIETAYVLYQKRKVELNRDTSSNTNLLPFKGLCAADPNGNADFLKLRHREWYLEKVIKPMIERGELDDGKKTPFDDRKLRYDGSSLYKNADLESVKDELLVSFGITHYQAFLADLNRSDEENLQLQERGRKELGERWAYFARAPGVAVLPINQDGTIFIGERTNKERNGCLNAVAGHLTYKDKVQEIDIPGETIRELEEELGIQPAEVSNLRFVGLYSHPIKGDLDFTFLADVAKPEQYFASGEWKKSVKEREHKDLVRLATMAEIQELLETGRVPGSDRTLEVIYSTRGALMSVYPEEIRN